MRWPQTADGLGAHAVYVCDHFMGHTDDDAISDEGMLESMTLLAALGPLTSRVRLGPLVLGGTYRHPAVVANQVAALDHVSDGRAIAGLGAGWQVNEHTAYGIDLPGPADLSDRFEESVAVVSALLRKTRSTFDGRHFRLHDAPNQPAPVQERLPILVGGGGERRTIPMAARYADVWHVWGTAGVVRAPRAPSSTRRARRSAATPARSGGPPASPTRSAPTTARPSSPTGRCATSSSSSTGRTGRCSPRSTT